MSEQHDVAVAAPEPLPMEMTVAQVKHQVEKIQGLMRDVLKEGVHYGVIPGTKKPTLYQPGAQKLCLMFRLSPEFEILREVADEDRIEYVIRCRLVHSPTGTPVSTGMGLCSSWESRYRYRHGSHVCPECGEPVRKSKNKPEWYCWKNPAKGANGCGKTWAEGSAVIEDQKVGKIVNEDPYDQANTVLKMACKRAMNHATLNGTAASDIFTQDVEDGTVPGIGPADTPAESPAPERTPEAARQELATRTQVDAMARLCKQIDQPWSGFIASLKDQYKVSLPEDLQYVDAESILEGLRGTVAKSGGHVVETTGTFFDPGPHAHPAERWPKVVQLAAEAGISGERLDNITIEATGFSSRDVPGAKLRTACEAVLAAIR